MLFEAMIANITIPPKGEEMQHDGITAADVSTIVGIEVKGGNGIIISRESWKRLEIFLALLSHVEMPSITEEMLKEFFKGK